MSITFGGKGSGIRLAAGARGARVYVRSAISTLDAMLPEERSWWAGVGLCKGSASDRAWQTLSAGVDILPLHQVSDVLSMLVRAEANVQLADHPHSLPEDCFMLRGDLFLGDLLLREDDYQLAPVGVTHVDIVSDTGALFFVHGMLAH